MEWLIEHWIIEAVLCIAIGCILAKIICVVVDLMNNGQ